MKTLCDKEFVKKTGRPARFQLTVQGFELAKFFLELDSLTTQNEEWFKLNSKSSVEESRQPEADLLVEDSDCCIILDSPLPKYKNTHNMESETLVIIDPINKLEDENLLSECEKVIGKLEDPNLTINTSSETITKNIFMDNKDLNYRKHQYLNLQQISNTGICLLVDNRENFSKKDRRCILEELQRRGVECVPRALPLGDFTWIAQVNEEEYMLGFIIERKRMDDLVASIFDSRFIEQQSRLAASGLSHVVYLVEDYGRMEAQKLPASSIRKAMVQCCLFSNFTLHRTKNIQETIEYLVTVHHKLHEYLTVLQPVLPSLFDLYHCYLS
ncbi:crossover junction endonuclease MUS81-like [Zophobas morio]|uniref:crossover junction endonuclease MUS81-like n=1 Tax=Zophobas morio TaxID=2755281 RepID=UPI003082D900